MSGFDFDVDSAIDELERLATEVDEAVPKAVRKMSSILEKRLKAKALFDPENTDGKHLKDLIGRTGVRTGKNGTKYQVVLIKDRGENDKNVYKTVVAEYGRSGNGGNGVKKDGTPSKIPNPFWRETYLESREEMLEAGKQVIEEAIEKAKNG